MNTYLTTR